MNLAAKIGLGAAGAVALLAGVVIVRTVTYEAPGSSAAPVALAAPVAVDVDAAASRLAESIRFQTISHQDPAEDRPEEWDRLHAWLQSAYPAFHKVAQREVIGKKTLLYTWKGSDPALAPIVLMAHQDVVPVTPGSEANWRYPPFDGVVADGAIWGRGSIDDKGSLIGLFEACEILARQGYQPKRTVILLSTEDEEVRGTGAEAAAAALKARGTKAEFVVDEGLAVLKANPVTGTPLALIGIGEKGYGTLTVTAPAPGGHSSAPPKDTGVVTLSRALVGISEHPFPMSLDGPGGAMLRTLAPQAKLPVRMAVANEWLFRPLLISQMGASPAGAALMHTTIAPTMLKGSPKENVLPQDATAWINLRLAPGDTADEVIAHIREGAGDQPVKIEWAKAPKEATALSSTSSFGWNVLSSLAADEAKAPVSPGLVTAGTDSRSLAPVAKDVYRFSAAVFDMDGFTMIHGTNEHLTVDNLKRIIQYNARLIVTATR